jgi:hypothetical protein
MKEKRDMTLCGFHILNAVPESAATDPNARDGVPPNTWYHPKPLDPLDGGKKELEYKALKQREWYNERKAPVQTKYILDRKEIAANDRSHRRDCSFECEAAFPNLPSMSKYRTELRAFDGYANASSKS